jgi:hypothetical protein
MKKIQLTFLLLFFVTLLYGQEEQVKTGPLMHFEEKVYDFGTVISGDTVEHTFVFENRGTEPLKILSARGSCGCTVPKYSAEAVMPGEKGEVFVRFRSAGRVGKQNKTVTLVTNAKVNNRMVLTIRGTVNRKESDD